MNKNLYSSFAALLFASLLAGAAYATTTAVDDTSGSITYSGSWALGTSFPGCFDNTQSYTVTTGNYAQFTFTGTSIIWIGARWTNRGMTDVYLDTVYQGRVDAYSASDLLQQNLFEKSGLTNASHTIKLVCTGVKNPSSVDYVTDVDEFSYSNDLPWIGTKIDDADTSDITYSGTWTAGADLGCYDGTEHYSNTVNDYAQFAFTGTSIRWTGALYYNRGRTGVYLDGALQMNVDAYSNLNLYQQVLFERTGLSNASHTIKLVCLHAHNGSSSDYYTDLDTFEVGGIWSADRGFSSVQGANQWYYQQRPQGASSPVTNLTWISTGGYSDSVYGSTGYYDTTDLHGYIYWRDACPGSSFDTLRKWVAPVAGTVSIAGRAFKENTSGGGGIIATVEKNGTSLWSKTLAYNDSTGYATDSALSAVSVASGDSIAFIVDDNGSFGTAQPQTGWDPTIRYNSGPTWLLNTSDTLLTLGIVGNRPAIMRLEDAATHLNWTPSPVTLPLLTTVNGSSIGWSYTTAAVDTSSGAKVTLTFSSTSPSLTLTQTWRAYPGAGPVEETQAITNSSGSAITINDSDVVASDFTATSDNAVTLWLFDRAASTIATPSDTNYTLGVLKTSMGTSTSVNSTISNTTLGGTFVLPFVMLDAGGVHGLYLGYESDFGKISNVSSATNAFQIRNLFQLWDSSSFTLANATTTSLPGMFYGTYTGDTDTGSNHMKKWFWNNKMTPTIISTTNEPLVEVACGIDSDASSDPTFGPYEASKFFNTDYPSLATWGVESVKEDSPWADDWQNTGHGGSGWDWIPNAPQWPNGFTDGSMAHSHGLKLVLYMANTFNNCGLSTTAGVTSEEGALIARYGNSPTAANFVGGYDTWRTDQDFEVPADYLSHLGFLQVVDYMISNESGFRWENCSGGGSKKSFDLLQRQSYLCVDDDGANTGTLEDYRQSYYASSYMINPVQLESQNVEFKAPFPLPTEDNAAHANYMFRLGFMGAWMNYLAVTLASIQDTLYSQTVPLYKTHQRPILRGADVYHILPICDSTHWDGIEYFNSALNKGSVVLFKPNSSVTTFPGIYLKGLIPTGTYSLKFQDRNGLNSSYTSVTGSALMSGGAGIGSFSGTASEYDSEIIWINY